MPTGPLLRRPLVRGALAWSLTLGLWMAALGPPQWPARAAADWRLLGAPLLLLPFLLPARRQLPGALLAGGALLAMAQQSLWSRLTLPAALAVGLAALAGLALSFQAVRRSRNPAVVPLLAVGTGVVLTLEGSATLGIEAAILGVGAGLVAAVLGGQRDLAGGVLTGLVVVVSASCAYAEAERVLPLLLAAPLSLFLTRGRPALVELLGVAIPLALACLPGALEFWPA